eukprot:11747451-Heterocapsa_arctica.AAC.1
MVRALRRRRNSLSPRTSTSGSKGLCQPSSLRSSTRQGVANEEGIIWTSSKSMALLAGVLASEGYVRLRADPQ